MKVKYKFCAKFSKQSKQTGNVSEWRSSEKEREDKNEICLHIREMTRRLNLYVPFFH
jgi:hypothetical protein